MCESVVSIRMDVFGLGGSGKLCTGGTQTRPMSSPACHPPHASFGPDCPHIRTHSVRVVFRFASVSSDPCPKHAPLAQTWSALTHERPRGPSSDSHLAVSVRRVRPLLAAHAVRHAALALAVSPLLVVAHAPPPLGRTQASVGGPTRGRYIKILSSAACPTSTTPSPGILVSRIPRCILRGFPRPHVPSQIRRSLLRDAANREPARFALHPSPRDSAGVMLAVPDRCSPRSPDVPAQCIPVAGCSRRFTAHRPLAVEFLQS